ncbi:hypothetical protein L1285_09450 [Pseudoalteromonas sp. DL2-H2.2]|uniref:hypothetical protein n=1 Tax=Pseudoalteromonas sp. DL2-H2.2 TaxID=2908889 RepID=UPI001F29D08F|nr:hypothetical protein [Pseudoalteromonas sp. DL2-H2.2]MCF2908550.1 hypothetical protein [Pseudoalteromonas sp. DL2-H2.2]
MQYLFVLLLLLSLHSTYTSAREVGDIADFVFADLYVDQQNFPEGAELLTHDYEHYFLSQDNLNALLSVTSPLIWQISVYMVQSGVNRSRLN